MLIARLWILFVWLAWLPFGVQCTASGGDGKAKKKKKRHEPSPSSPPTPAVPEFDLTWNADDSLLHDEDLPIQFPSHSNTELADLHSSFLHSTTSSTLPSISLSTSNHAFLPPAVWSSSLHHSAVSAPSSTVPLRLRLRHTHTHTPPPFHQILPLRYLLTRPQHPHTHSRFHLSIPLHLTCPPSKLVWHHFRLPFRR